MKIARKIIASLTLLLLFSSLYYICNYTYDLTRPPEPGEMNEAGLIILMLIAAGILITIFTVIYLIYYLMLMFNKNTHKFERFYFYLSIILTIILILFLINLRHILVVLFLAPLIIIDLIAIVTCLLHKSYFRKKILNEKSQ
jgi:hypothetical protein